MPGNEVVQKWLSTLILTLSDIQTWIGQCEQCQLLKRSRLGITEAYQPTQVYRPFQRVIIDTLGPFERTARGNRYLLFIDAFTKWPEAYAIPEQTSVTISTVFLEEIIARHGCPEEVLSDGGLYFKSEHMEAMFKLYGISKLTGPPYHHATQGLAERMNAALFCIICLQNNPTCHH